MTEAFICDAVRTPIGRYGGALSAVRTDDLGAIPLRALLARNPKLDPAAIEEVLYGCANQAGEDNRNVARMALLLAGLPQEVPAATINRLCGSGMDAVGTIARAIRAGEIELAVAGGVDVDPVVGARRLAVERDPETDRPAVGATEHEVEVARLEAERDQSAGRGQPGYRLPAAAAQLRPRAARSRGGRRRAGPGR